MKGFGITLRSGRDFRLTDSSCASDVTFSAQYGAHGDGDVCRPENISHFVSRVVHECENLGVHFMMSDGVNRNLYEIDKWWEEGNAVACL